MDRVPSLSAPSPAAIALGPVSVSNSPTAGPVRVPSWLRGALAHLPATKVGAGPARPCTAAGMFMFFCVLQVWS